MSKFGENGVFRTQVYNLGVERLQESTLLRLIREGAPEEKIQGEFQRWCHSGKKRLTGLERRCLWRTRRWAS